MSEEKQFRKTKAEKVCEELTERLKNLERCFAKVCHMTGTERNLDEFGIERWKPGKNDMGKYKD